MDRWQTRLLLDVIQVERWVDAKKVWVQNFVSCCLKRHAMARSDIL